MSRKLQSFDKTNNLDRQWETILYVPTVYVDNATIISHNVEEAMKKLYKYFNIKPNYLNYSTKTWSFDT